MLKRKPVMEFDVLEEMFTENEDKVLAELIKDKSFLERILLNSESLFNMLPKVFDDSPKFNPKVKHALLKYVLRMASRPQPNKLNSGICLDEESYFNGKQEVKKVEISLEWEQRLIKQIEEKLLNSQNIKLVLNPKLYKMDRQYILENFKVNSTSYIYIESSEFLDDTLNTLKTPTALKDIISKYDDEEDKQAVLEVVKDLVKADIVKTEMSSCSINRDSDDFIEKIKQLCSHDKELINQIEGIKTVLEQYRNAEIGDGIESYKKLVSKMSALCKSSSYLIVDLYIYDPMAEKEHVLRNLDVDESLKILKFFNKLNRFDWKNYYNSFLNKYGSFTKIPLLQMIDKDEGIGLPHHIRFDSNNKKIEEYLLNRIMQSNLAGDSSLKLNEEDYVKIKNLYGNEDSHRIPISFDCKITTCGNQALLPPNAFAFPRNSFTGRFAFGNKKGDNQTQYTEINYISNYFKDVGLTYKSESPSFIDCIGQTNQLVNRIPLNEIEVFASDGKLYLVHEDEVIYPVNTHLLNYRNFNEHPALIFLHEYTLYCFEYPSNFPIESLSYLEYVPRVEYNDLIISAARVNLKFEKESTKEDRINKIKQVLETYKLNRYKYVYFLEGDKTLPVPTTNASAIEFLEACKHKYGEEYGLTLMEAPELEHVEGYVSDWIYSSENVVHIDDSRVKHLLEVSNKILDKMDPNTSSYHLYYRSGKREKVERWILQLGKNELLLENLFIVNYIDEKNKEHIRVRYKKNPEKDFLLEEKLSEMLIAGDLYDFKKTLFIPEINRYGGKEVYELVYKLFASDTEAIPVFKSLYADYTDIESALYIASYTLLELLGWDVDLLFEYLESTIKKDLVHVKAFSKRRNRYREIALKAKKDLENCSNPILINHLKLSNEVLNQIHKVNLNKEEIFYLVASVIHMTMNRHFPFNRELEDETNKFMRFTFSNLNYYLRGGLVNNE